MRRLPALVLIALASCARCAGPKSASTAEELLPQSPAGALVTAPLGGVAQHLAELSDRAASLPGGEQLGDARKSLAAQLGFDPLTRDGLLSAGIDPDRGAAIAFFSAQPTPEWTLALPLTNADKFLQTAQRLLAERGGFAPLTGAPSQAKIFERSGARVGVGVVRGYGLVARAADPAARVVAPPPEQSLRDAQGLRALRNQLGAQDFIVWAPRGSDLPHRYTPRDLPGDVGVSLQPSRNGLATRLHAQLPPAEAGRARAVLPGGGASLGDVRPAAAPLRARLGIAPRELLASARRQPDLAPILEKLRGADAEVADSIAPGIAVSLALEKTANIGAVMDYGLDIRKRSPFDTVQLVMLARAVDRPRLTRALQAVAQTLPSLGAKVQRSGDEYSVTYPAGQGPRFGVREIEGKPVAYLLGGTISVSDLKRSPRPASGEAAALYEDPGATVRIDFGKLAAALAALPESAYGSGPQSYVARSLVSQILEPLRPVRLTFDAQATEDHFGSILDVEIAP